MLGPRSGASRKQTEDGGWPWQQVRKLARRAGTGADWYTFILVLVVLVVLAVLTIIGPQIRNAFSLITHGL